MFWVHTDAMGSANNPQPTLTMCIDHYPPLQVVLNDGKATGRNVELTRAFFARLGYRLKFTADIPFRRCLQWLKDGEVDVMTGLLSSEERHSNFHMFLYDDHTVKSFFVQKGTAKIEKFSDLRGLNIAVVRGTSQFEAFDNAPQNMFEKTRVNTLPAAFGMLEKGRVDAVVCTEYCGDNIIKSNPRFATKLEKSQYREINGTKVYIALSKKSQFAHEAQSFNNLAVEMFLSGEFKELAREYKIEN
jgi:polar amino acid transport system substrate-binding protein